MSYSNNKYEKYTVEDWVVDDDFIAFVNGTHHDHLQDLMGNSNFSEDMKTAKFLVKDLQKVSPSVEDQNLANVFSRIQQTISVEKPIEKENKKPFKIINIAWVTGIAAAIALLLIFYPSENSYETGIAEQETLSLPDASVVQLNADTKLRFNKKTWSEKRNVQLEGEAFFKVEKGSEFTVFTDEGSVTVLGTQFNVYDRNGVFEVECLEGRVKVESNGEKYILEAGDRFTQNQNPMVEKKVVEEIDWLQTYVKVRDQQLGFVFREMERYFKVEFINKESVQDLKYDGFFTTNRLDSAVYQVLWPLGISYDIEGNKVIIK